MAEKKRKIRKHIKISENNGVTFEDVIFTLLDIVNNIIKDELISFVQISSYGEVVLNTNISDDIEQFIPKTGTCMRIFTANKEWKFTVIKRITNVTLIDISTTADEDILVEKVFNIIVDKFNGVLIGDLSEQDC